jgi:hypothetical protein
MTTPNFMKVENPAALSFILQDDVYLLNTDKLTYSEPKAEPVIETPIIEIETPPVKFNYLGGHKKNFLVIVHYPGKEFIEEIHLTALENVFKRLGLSLDDVAIFNLANYNDFHFEKLTEYFKPQKLLVLGKLSLPDGIEALTLNTPQKVGNFQTLYSFSFDEMMDSNENKKAFWEQMKQL